VAPRLGLHAGYKVLGTTFDRSYLRDYYLRDYLQGFSGQVTTCCGSELRGIARDYVRHHRDHDPQPPPPAPLVRSPP
jgi:hypothetical protein